MSKSILDLLTDLEKKPNAKKYTAEGYDLSGFTEWLQESIGWGSSLSPSRPAIHIAGTKGKGSTAAMVEALLAESGCSTGLYTSPHANHFGERFRLSGQPLSLEQFEQRCENLIRPQIEKGDKEHSLPTVFEVLTALAFQYFHEQKVDAEIYEVGLGGRLDSTNVIQPDVTVITPIGLDHTNILGDTVEKIAAEKAGIIKPNTPLVLFDAFDDLREKARDVILQIAVTQNAPIIHLSELISQQPTESGQTVILKRDGVEVVCELSMRGKFQGQNWRMAVAAVDAFLQKRNRVLTNDAIQRASSSIKWQGRMQVLRSIPAVVIDSAHCPLSAKALGESLEDLQQVAPGPYTILWGMQKDKDHLGFLEALKAAAPEGSLSRIVCYHVPGERGALSSELFTAGRKAVMKTLALETVEDAFGAAMQLARPGSVLACGTVYTTARIAELHAAMVEKARES